MRLIKLWLPVFIWCALIFYLSAIPYSDTEFANLGREDFLARKVLHMLEYFILTYLLYRALKGSFGTIRQRLLFWSAALAFLYAVSDEIHQAFVPTRSCRVQDVIIDGMGILFFVLLLRYGTDKQKRLRILGRQLPWID